MKRPEIERISTRHRMWLNILRSTRSPRLERTQYYNLGKLHAEHVGELTAYIDHLEEQLDDPQTAGLAPALHARLADTISEQAQLIYEQELEADKRESRDDWLTQKAMNLEHDVAHLEHLLAQAVARNECPCKFEDTP